MKVLDALNIINDITASQRGYFTAAQAVSAGIDRMALSRLSAHEQIEPISPGVYRAAAAPSIREEDIYVAWLSTNPSTPAYLRTLESDECIASLGTAAWLHGFGELKPEPITFSCPKRKQSRNASLRFLKRTLPKADICMVAGIPTTTPKRTILDLIEYGEDLSLVSSVLRDAEHADPTLNLQDQIDELGRKHRVGQI